MALAEEAHLISRECLQLSRRHRRQYLRNLLP